MDVVKYQKIPREIIEKYMRTNYRVVGKHKHTSIKPCHWMGQKLQTGRDNRNCYKGYWGIKSETCIQNSPSYPFCNHNCVFCWRIPEGNLDTKFNVIPDEPDFLINELIRHNVNIVENNFPLEKNLQNFWICNEILEKYWASMKYCLPCQAKSGKVPLFSQEDLLKKMKEQLPNIQMGRAILLLKNTSILKTDDTVNYYLHQDAFNFLKANSGDTYALLDKYVTNENDIKNAYKNALQPQHAAISLDGEPTLYPLLGEFIAGFRKKGFTTFVVTNGTNPDAIKSLSDSGTLPSILYITIPPPSIELYKKVCRPKIKGTWDRIMRSMSMVQDLKCRTVFRITSVKDLNVSLDLVQSYVDLINQMNPNFIDIKGFTYEGASMDISAQLDTDKAGSEFVPDFNYLMRFAQKLSESGGFKVLATHEKSRDILLGVNWSKNKSLILEKNEF